MDFYQLQPLSLIDFPGKVAAICFTSGCPFRCPFCYNGSLVLKEQSSSSISEEELLAFLKTRQGLLDGLVVTGGEPTIHPSLAVFLKEVKKLGFLVKLDSSGAFPKVLEYLLQNSLVDYVAMDLKAPLEKYSLVAGAKVEKEAILRSIDLLRSSSITYEFRSTLVPTLHEKRDLPRMAQLIQGASLYALQTFDSRPPLLNASLRDKPSFSKEEMEEMRLSVLPYVQQCLVR